LWKEIVNKKEPGYFIFEADVFCAEPVKEEEWKEFWNKKNPHFLSLGTFYSLGSPDGPLLNRLTRFMGLHAYFITYEGAKLLLEHALPIE
jgi:hypothetical protein